MDVTQSLHLQFADYQKVRDQVRALATDVRNMSGDIKQQIADVNTLEKAWSKLSQTIGQATKNAGGGAGAPSPGGGSGGSGGGSSSPPIYRTPRQPPTFSGQLARFFTSSRFSAVNGALNMQPLVGQGLKLLSTLGPIGTLGGAAASVVTTLHALASAAADTTNRFTALSAMTGGNPYETARLRGLGIDGGAARGLLDRITSDPTAMGVAGRFGVTAVPGPYGTLDAAGATLKVLDQLRKESGEQQQRDMRILGLEGLGGLLKLSDGQYELMKKEAAVAARINGSAFGRQLAMESSDFSSSASLLAASMKDFTQVASGPLIKAFTDFNNGFAEFLQRSTDRNQKELALFPGGNGKLKDDAALSDPNQENTEALTNATGAIRQLTKSMNLSERGQRAIPSALTGANFHRALQMGALPTGTM